MIGLLGQILLTQLPVLLFGLPFAFLPSMRRRGLGVRMAGAWLSGLALLTFVAPLLAISGAWGERSIAIPLVLFSVGGCVVLSRRKATPDLIPSGRSSPFAAAMLLAAIALLFMSIAAGSAIDASALDAELAKSERWADESVQPELFTLEAPGAPPLPSIAPMWSSMLLEESAIGGGAWFAFLLLVAVVPLVGLSLSSVLDRPAAALATAGFATSCVIALSAGSLAGGSVAWLLIAIPALALAASLEGTDAVCVVLSAITAASHGGGLGMVIALAIVVSRSDRPRAMRMIAAAVAILLPWWTLLALRIGTPFPIANAVAVSPWQPGDAGLLLILVISLIFAIYRGRRALAALPMIVAVCGAVMTAALWTVSGAAFALLALRLVTPLALLVASFLVLRPLVRNRLRQRVA